MAGLTYGLTYRVKQTKRRESGGNTRKNKFKKQE
jgi:hypothetical protein